MIQFDFHSFFDRKAVVDAIDSATRRVLSKFGAYVRRTARSSIRTRKGVSAPMGPPSGHVGTLKRGIVFGYDRESRSVVIGPAPATSVVDRRALPALEYGGRSTALDHGKRKAIQVKPRPFMGPALAKELPGLPAMWRDSVR